MLTLTTRTDIHGNPVSGSPAAVDRYDAAVDHLLAYRNDLLDAMTSLAADEPDFPMGQVLAAYLSLTSTDLPDVAGAREIAAHLGALTLNEREAAHHSVLDTWLAGDWHGAARRLDSLLIRWPADLLGLLVGHQLDFFLGDAANLRDRVGRSLPAIDPAHPHHGYVRGMYAFGLEESGNYQLAERHGLAAVERNRDDVWATHAVVHVYEMQGRVDEGIRFLQGPQADWAEGNLFTVHNWWHLALYLLEAGRSDESLSIYDQHIHNDHSAGVPLEMLDASALLWRPTSTASTWTAVSRRSPMHGRHAHQTNRGTCSTTCMPSWHWPERAGSSTLAPLSTASTPTSPPACRRRPTSA